MNTRNDTPTRIRISEDEVQPQVKQPQRKQPDQRVLRVLRFGMFASGAVIVVLALTMLILPVFKINKIEVEGNSYYDDEAVIQMAGIAVGDELFGWNMQAACNAIIRGYNSYANDVYVSISFFTVKIEIVENPEVLYAEYQNQYFSMDRNLRVLEIKTNGEEAFSPFLRVKLPQVLGVQVGYTVQFADAETDVSYLTQLLDILTARNLLDKVTYIDVSERFSLSFILSDTVRVEIGAFKDMDLKLTLLEEQLAQNPINHNIYEIINLSDTSKATRREIDGKNLFD